LFERGKISEKDIPRIMGHMAYAKSVEEVDVVQGIQEE
jgi:hypothetical protein